MWNYAYTQVEKLSANNVGLRISRFPVLAHSSSTLSRSIYLQHGDVILYSVKWRPCTSHDVWIARQVQPIEW